MDTHSLSVGFTGTRHKLRISQDQLHRFHELILSLKPTAFHHGDCVGADCIAHSIICSLRERDWDPSLSPDTKIVVHPPTNSSNRAFCIRVNDNDVLLPAKPYHVRNLDIVKESDVMIAMPGERPDSVWNAKGGTFSTIRMALKANKCLLIIWPSGKVESTGEYPPARKEVMQ